MSAEAKVPPYDKLMWPVLKAIKALGGSATVGTFLGDITFNGKPTKVRYVWSKMTGTSAHWEQAFSADGGDTWETNWYADFKKVACPAE
jgi:hypothetical protein